MIRNNNKMETFGPIHNSSNSSNSSDQSIVSLLLALSPLILVLMGSILIVMYYIVILPSYEATLQKYYDYIETKNSPIKNGKLNSNYIKLLYENNKDNIKSKIVECMICLNEINLDMHKHTNLVFLKCNHVYHEKCLNSWVKETTKKYNKPTCPGCRDIIIDIPKTHYNYNSDNSDYD
jgi:hypothetical protein